ncbi:Vasoactive intestinal polypeptide receptor [Bagarius yarrelli]|uniref:Vasoactive intestinal polypeptide receptor n=1 Tax=Bagarius yarrelli TaxID=175774 RepID=A0A556U8H3_BAGYA|nr:Vasoactive intestinal polypeptide receptor [Bagarius yarrelli]
MEVLRRALVLCLSCSLGPMLLVEMCDIRVDLEMERDECLARPQNVTLGCSSEWDFACWPSAFVGQLVTIPCPKYFTHVSDREGNISRLCTEHGWTNIDPTVSAQDCGYSLNVTEVEDFSHGEFLRSVRIGYTIGHAVSLASLIIAIFILCFFRKLHCTRNYIHIHLFLSFILKAIAVIMKDVALYEVDPDDCSPGSIGCKAAVAFFQYGVMASFFWLLVEGLYLYALLAVSFFSHRKYFWWYILIGWGVPALFITTWSVTKAYLHDVECITDNFLCGKIPTNGTDSVQSEIKRKWRRWHMQRFLGTGTKYHQPSLASNGSTSHTQITMLTKCSPTTHRISNCMDDFSSI